MKFSREPIVWIGFFIAALMASSDYLKGNFGMETLDALVVATGAVIGRKLVIPVAKSNDEV